MPGRVHHWLPLKPSEVGAALNNAGFDWWIAGGYALELFAGQTWRSHDDIDILVLRPDLPIVLTHFAEWDVWLADPPGHLRSRKSDEFDTKAHDIWLREFGSASWRLQIMVDEAQDDLWQSRRNPQLRLTRTALGWRHASGLPCLAPQVQLFYKAKSPRPKDELDRLQVIPMLDDAQRRWLFDAIAKTYGENHLWLATLT